MKLPDGRTVAPTARVPRLSPLLQGFFALAIYLTNFYGFTRLFPWFIEARSFIAVLVHVSWGIVLPLVYEALADRTRRSQAPVSP